MLKNNINSPNEETDTSMLVKAQGMCLLKRVKIKADAVITFFSGTQGCLYNVLHYQVLQAANVSKCVQ